MDTKNLSGLLFLLGTAAVAMPGCDDDDNDTGADTDGMTATGTSTGPTSSTGSASDSDTTPSTASGTTPTTESDTTPTTESDTTPTTATDGETDTDGTTITDTDSNTDTDTDTDTDGGTAATTGVDTEGPNEVCTGYATVYEDCYEGTQEYSYEMNVAFCETVIADDDLDCAQAAEALFGCISGLECKAFNSKKSCAAEDAAAVEACPDKKGSKKG